MTDDNKETITIEMEGTFELTAAEVFPDGVPDRWTIADVIRAMDSTGNIPSLISAWVLLPDVTVSVDRPNPDWTQDEVPFGDPQPRRIFESESWDR